METTSPKFFCFVLMPFATEFDDIYNYGIKESCKDAGAYCERVDEQIYHERILDRIYNQIAKADLIIADMTGRNANVFYEVGYAHALNKPTILLTQKADDIPFDLKHFSHIVYEKKIANIRADLTKRVSWFRENAGSKETNYKVEIDIYVDDQNIASGNVTHEFPDNQVPHFEFTIHNNSSRTYQPGEFQIGIISNDFDTARNRDVTSTRLPNKKYLHMLPPFEQLFPNSYCSSRFSFAQKTVNGEEINDFEITVSVFTDLGRWDHNLNLKRAIQPESTYLPDQL